MTHTVMEMTLTVQRQFLASAKPGAKRLRDVTHPNAKQKYNVIILSVQLDNITKSTQ